MPTFAEYQSTVPPNTDLAEVIRGYRGQTQLDLLRNGEYSDELVSSIDAQLQQHAVDNGIDPPDFAAKQDTTDADLHLVSRHSADPAAIQAARTYAALRDPRTKVEGDPTYEPRLEAAKLDFEKVAKDAVPQARRAALNSGELPFAVTRTAEGDTLDLSPEMKSFVGNDKALAALFEAHPELDKNLIPAVRQKLAVPEGLTAPQFEIDRSHDFLDTFGKTATEDPAILTQLNELQSAVDSGHEDNLDPGIDQIVNQLSGQAIADEFTKDEQKAGIRDMLLMNRNEGGKNFMRPVIDAVGLGGSARKPEDDTEHPDNAVRFTSTGQAVLPKSTQMNKALFDRTLKDSKVIPEAQKPRLVEQRNATMEAYAPEAFKTITAMKGDEFLPFFDKEKAAGKSNTEILDAWTANKDNHSSAWDYVAGGAQSLWDTGTNFALTVPMLAGNKWSREVIMKGMKVDSDRRLYAQMFGAPLGYGYDFETMLAPIGAQIAVAALTDGASVAALGARTGLKTAVKSAFSTALSAEAKGALANFGEKAAARSLARGVAPAIAEEAGSAATKGFARAQVARMGAAGDTQSVLKLIGDDFAHNIRWGAANASMMGTVFVQTAGQTYPQIYADLEQSGKYTPEQIRDISLKHATIQGLSVMAITGGLNFLGHAGAQSVITEGLTKSQTTGIFKRLQKDWGKLAPEVREGIDMANPTAMLASVIKKSTVPLYKTLGKHAGDEALDEGLGQLAQNIDDSFARDEKINPSDLLKQVVYASFMGAAMGVAFPGARELHSKATGGKVDPNLERNARMGALLSTAQKLEATAPQTAAAVREMALNGIPEAPPTTPTTDDNEQPAANPQSQVSVPAVPGSELAADPASEGDAGTTPAAVDESPPQPTPAQVATARAGYKQELLAEWGSRHTRSGLKPGTPAEVRDELETIDHDAGLYDENETTTNAEASNSNNADSAGSSEDPAQERGSLPPVGAEGAAARPQGGAEQAVTPQRTPEEQQKVARWEELTYQASQSKLPGKARAKKLTKAEEKELATLTPEVRPLVMETVDRKTDPVVGVDIHGTNIQQSSQGTFYTYENGRVRTGPAFSEATPAPEPTPTLDSTADASLRSEPAAVSSSPDTLPATQREGGKAGAAPSATSTPEAPATGTPDVAASGDTPKVGDPITFTSTVPGTQTPTQGVIAAIDAKGRITAQVGKTKYPNAKVVAQDRTEIHNPEAVLAAAHIDPTPAERIVTDALTDSDVPEAALAETPGGKEALAEVVNEAAPEIVTDGMPLGTMLDLGVVSENVKTLVAAEQDPTAQSIALTRETLQQRGRESKPDTRFTAANSPVTKDIAAHGDIADIKAWLTSVAKTGKPEHRELAKLLLKFPAVKVTAVHLQDAPFAGTWVPETGQALINTARPGPRGGVDTVLHELVHAATHAAIKNPTPEQALVLKRIDGVRRNVAKRAAKAGRTDLGYATSSLDEFFTHLLTSPTFQREVAAMTPKGERDWVHVLIDAVRDLLGMKTGVLRDMIEFTQSAADLKYGRHAMTTDGRVLMLPAHHGTPHKVDKFSTDKIGTGEGAQAYGYGLYFAQSHGVAKSYAENLTNRNVENKIANISGQIAMWSKELEGMQSGRFVEQRNQTEKRVQTLQAELDELRQSQGNIYTVEILPDESELLDWDKPLSEQSEKVREALMGTPEAQKPFGNMTPTGEAIYRRISVAIDPENGAFANGGMAFKAASEKLNKLGIPGIKFLDGNSRNRPIKEIKASFLDALPENAEFDDMKDAIDAGSFKPEQVTFLKALEADDWLGFDYPAQAISAALGPNVTNWDASKTLLDSIKPLHGEVSHNYVIFNDADIRITHENGVPVSPEVATAPAPGGYGTSRMDALMQMPEDVRDTVRFHELTEDLGDTPTQADIDSFKSEQPERYAELKAMRERVLRGAGYDNSHRRTKGKDFTNSTDVILFNDTAVGKNFGYGDNEWLVKSSDFAEPPAAVVSFASEFYGVDEAEASALVMPRDIVDTAKAWDDRQFVSELWQAMENGAVPTTEGYRTPDGVVIIDPYSAANKMVSTEPLSLDPATGQLIPPHQWGDTESPSILFQPAEDAPEEITPATPHELLDASHAAGIAALDNATEDEHASLRDYHDLTTTGNVSDRQRASYRVQPNALERLVTYLKAAVKHLADSLKQAFNMTSAVHLDRLQRELAAAEDGYRIRSGVKPFDVNDGPLMQPAAGGLFHATDVELKVGDTLKPGSEIGRKNHPLSKEGRVHLSADPNMARVFGEDYTKTGKVFVYRVEAPDADKVEPGLSDEESHEYTASTAVVVERIDGPLFQPAEDEPSTVGFFRVHDGSHVLTFKEGEYNPAMAQKGVKAWLRNVFGTKSDLTNSMAETATSGEHMQAAIEQKFNFLMADYVRAAKGISTDLMDKVNPLLNYAVGDSSPMLTPGKEQELNDTLDAKIKAAHELSTPAQTATAIDEANQWAQDTKVKFEIEEAEARIARRDKAQEELDRLHPEMGSWARKMRTVLTDTQKELLRRYGKDHPMYAKIDRSLGVYLVRAYAIHRDPHLADKLLHDPAYKETRDAAINFFEEQLSNDMVEKLKGKTPDWDEMSTEQQNQAVEAQRVGDYVNRMKRSGEYANVDDSVLQATAKLNVANQAQFLFEDLILGNAKTGNQSGVSGDSLKTNVSRFMKKDNIPDVLKDALAEITDPVWNATHTFAELANLVESHRMLTTLTQSGIDSGILVPKAKVDADPKKYHGWQPVAAADTRSRAYAPLAGYYANPQNAEAFKAVFRTGSKEAMDTAQKSANNATRFMMSMAGVALGTTTLGNVGYYIRNPIGGVFNLLSQGHNPLAAGSLTAGRDVARAAFDAQNDPNAEKSLLHDVVLGKDTAETEARILKLTALGMIGNGSQIGYTREITKLAMENPSGAMDAAQSIIGKGSVKLAELFAQGREKGKEFVHLLGSMAQVSEEVPMIIAFNANVDMLTRAQFGTPQAIEQEAARRAKRQIFAKSETSQGVKAYSHNPIGAVFAPFARFKADVFRVLVNSYQDAYADMKSDNAVIKADGQKRMLSALAVHAGLTVALPLLLAKLAGIGGDEDKALRAAAPSYDKNTSFWFFKTKDGVASVNLTYLNSFSFALDPLTGVLRSLMGGNSDQIPGIIARTFTDEVFGENIVAGKVIDLKRNVDESTGLPLWLDTDDAATRTSKMIQHVASAYVPGVVSTMKKAYDSSQRPENSEQPWYYTPEGIIFGQFAPTKIRPINLEDAAYRAFRDEARAQGQHWQITAPMRSPQGFPVGDVEGVYNDLRRADSKVQHDTYRIIQGYKSLGVDARTIRQRLTDAGFSKTKTASIMAGYGVKRNLSPDAIEKMNKTDPALWKRWKELDRQHAERMDLRD